jgi:hypothetical protein
VTYLWTGEFTNARVSCQATVKGQTLTAQAFFNVKKPEVAWTLTAISPVTVDARVDRNDGGLMCGRGKTNDVYLDQVGMIFSYTVVNRKGYPGSLQLEMVHLISTSLTATSINTNDPPLVLWVPFVLDTLYPYRGIVWTASETSGETNRTDDSPWESTGGNLNTLSRGDQYKAYLLYTPSGGKPTPLKVADWAWSGVAQRLTNNSQVVFDLLGTPVNPHSTNGQRCAEPPTWTNNIINFR